MINKVRFRIVLAGIAVFSGLFLPVLAAAEPQARPTPVILEEISRLLAQSKFADAIALFDNINPADAGSSQIKLLKASVLNSAGNAKEARELAEEVTKAEPNNLEALYVLSAIEGAAGRNKEQKALLEKIIKADPKNVEALTDLATLNRNTNNNRAAAQYYDQALAIQPENLEALLGRARIHRLNKEPKSAEKLLNRAITNYPNVALVWHERGRLYRGANFPIQALSDLDKAKALDPNDYWIALDRGNVLLDLNRKELALQEYQRAVNLNPNEFLAYAYTAGIKDDLGDFEGAGKDYETLARLKPDYYFAFEGVGMHKMRDGQWAQARDAFMEVYRQVPNEWYYALLAAINAMKADNQTSPRQFLNQAMAKVKRDTMEYYLLRLFYDLSGRVYAGENDMLLRADRETNLVNKARMVFYLANYYDIRGNAALANKYFLQFKQMDQEALPEWRLNEWLIEERGIQAW
jgi:tetratricopeptide (TPR) repeat protein